MVEKLSSQLVHGLWEYRKWQGEVHHPLPIDEPSSQPSLLIKSKRYGEMASYLHPNFEGEAAVIRTPSFAVPTVVQRLCVDLKNLGGRALVVGGSIRDALLNEHRRQESIVAKDFDLEVYGLAFADLYRYLMLNFDEGAIDTVGKAFGIIKLTVPDLPQPIDISIPRRDSKVDQGHLGFAVTGDPSMTIREASQRRDLRMNSVAFDPLTNTIYDPFGAQYDLEQNVISVTDPEKFGEDPLRVLRVMQFVARFEMTATPETILICQELVESGEIETLPKERITEEFKKLLLKGRRPSLGLEFARQVGLVEVLWPELAALIDVPQNPDWHPEGDVWLHTLQTLDAAAEIADRENLNDDQKLVLLLTLICHDLAKPEKTVFERGAWRSPGHEVAGVKQAARWLARFMWSEKIVAQILALVPEHMQPKMFWMLQFPDTDKPAQDMSRAIRRLATRLGKGQSSIAMLALVAEADQRGRNGASDIHLTRDQVPDLEVWQAWLLETARELGVEDSAPVSLLKGKDIMTQLQLQRESIGIGVLLRQVFLDQLDGVVTTFEEAELQANMYLQKWADCYQVELVSVADYQTAFRHPSWRELISLEDPRTW